jgi:hypothetical protein
MMAVFIMYKGVTNEGLRQNDMRFKLTYCTSL